MTLSLLILLSLSIIDGVTAFQQQQHKWWDSRSSNAAASSTRETARRKVSSIQQEKTTTSFLTCPKGRSLFMVGFHCSSKDIIIGTTNSRRQRHGSNRKSIVGSTRLNLSDWSDFADMDDDDMDDLYGSPTSTTNIQWADENDTPEDKAAVGSMLKAPEIEGPYYEPLVVPQGSQIDLSEENVQRLLAACRDEIQTMFGYTAQNRGVGITGGVDFVELDGPVVVLKLKGRFWHQRTTVLSRVGAYLMGRIPEIVDVVIDDPYELTDEANNSAE